MITSLNRSITIAAVFCFFGINAATAGNICHATGYTLDEEGDGLSWSSPMSLPQALATVQSSNWSEIWLKGDVTVSSAPSEVSINNNLIIRGGFTGHETDPSERPQGSMSMFSGNNTYNIMVVKVAAGMTLSFERVFFTKAVNCALKKLEMARYSLPSLPSVKTAVQLATIKMWQQDAVYTYQDREYFLSRLLR
jgi:hypothetical protein